MRRILPFISIGLVGLAVDAGLFAVLADAGLSRAAGRALSLGAATAVTFALNRTITFPAPAGRAGAPDLARQAVRYGLVTLLSQGTSFGLFLMLAHAMPALAALVAGAAAATAVSFAGHRLFTFHHA